MNWWRAKNGNRVLTDLSPQAIWAGDCAGQPSRSANQGFLAYIGLRTEDLNGAGWLEAFAPADRDRVVRVWTQSVTTGEDYEIEAMIRHASTGEHRYLGASRERPCAMRRGAIVQWLGVGSDVHDMKMNAALLLAEQAEGRAAAGGA